MKNFLRACQKTIIFLLKILMFAAIFFIFFGLYNIFFVRYLPHILPDLRRNLDLFAFSQLTAVTAITFIIVGISFIRIYGGCAIGIKKSKEIISSVFLATIVTDIITFIQLTIMALGVKTFTVATWYMLGIMILALFLQYLVLVGFVYFGNWLYFQINDPVSTAVFYGKQELLSAYLSKIGRYKKQWKITEVAQYKNEEWRRIVRRNGAVFLFDVPAKYSSRIVEYCYKYSKAIYLSPEVSDIVIKYAQDMQVDDTTVLAANIQGLSIEQAFVKRLSDILLSLVAIILTSPIMLIEAIAIKLYDKGPILYSQTRYTRNAKVFHIYKFRTMVTNAEKIGTAVLSSENDPRITPVGRVLRKLRIDELPQFFNILIGDMSFVGPRPEREVIAREYEKDIPGYRYRLKVKAGLTGLAQILAKYNTKPKDKLVLDLVYIQRYTIWLDIKLLFQTFIIFFKKDSTEGFGEEDHVEFIKHDAVEDKQDLVDDILESDVEDESNDTDALSDELENDELNNI